MADAKGERTTISVSMSVEDKRDIRILAAQKDTTVSGLISDWIAQEKAKSENK